MKFDGGFPIPQPEYIEKAKRLPETEVKRLIRNASEGRYDLYYDGIWSKEELLAVELELKDSRDAFLDERAKKRPDLYPLRTGKLIKFKDGTPIPKLEYIEKAKQLSETEAKSILKNAHTSFYELYQDGILSKEELLAAEMELKDSRSAFYEAKRKKRSEPSTPPTSS